MVTIEEIVIEAEKWEDEIDNEKCEVKFESAHEIKVKESEQKKASELSKELSEERSTNASALVEKQKGKPISIAKSKDVRRDSYCTNYLNFAMSSVSCYVQVK